MNTIDLVVKYHALHESYKTLEQTVKSLKGRVINALGEPVTDLQVGPCKVNLHYRSTPKRDDAATVEAITIAVCRAITKGESLSRNGWYSLIAAAYQDKASCFLSGEPYPVLRVDR